jgi:alpha/beta superfamily hydrolase
LESNKTLPRPIKHSIAGPAGALETLIETPSDVPVAFGVICHPHPLFGGTLNNKVVHTLARSFQELGAATLRFNFRGVAASEGSFADGVGETDDALAVIAEGVRRWPKASVWLGGFSFGGAVAVRAAARVDTKFLVTVAPAVTLVDVTDIKVPECPWLIVQGAADELVNSETVVSWAARLSPAPTVRVLPGVGHFFHGQLRELSSLVVDFARERGLS